LAVACGLAGDPALFSTKRGPAQCRCFVTVRPQDVPAPAAGRIGALTGATSLQKRVHCNA